jgi:hypothetical protein
MARNRDDDDEPRRRRRDDDDQYSDEPRSRRRRDEDDEDDRPRRRRRDEDDDDDDRPRRRRRSIRRDELTGLDAMFANTNIVALVLFGCLCGGIAGILGFVGVLTCKDEKAKQNAMITMIIGGVMLAIGIVVQVLLAFNR